MSAEPTESPVSPVVDQEPSLSRDRRPSLRFRMSSQMMNGVVRESNLCAVSTQTWMRMIVAEKLAEVEGDNRDG